LRDKN